MKITKELFVSRWQSWWAVDKRAVDLNKAFENELEELICPQVEITKDTLSERGFNPKYTELIMELPRGYSIVAQFNHNGVSIYVGDDNNCVHLINCKTLAQLDSLIEMFKTE